MTHWEYFKRIEAVIDLRAFARVSGCSPTLLERWAKAGGEPPIEYRKGILWLLSELGWIEDSLSVGSGWEPLVSPWEGKRTWRAGKVRKR